MQRTVNIEDAKQHLTSGGVLLCPTESVFGFSACYDQDEALQAIIQLKQRAPSQGLVVVISQFEQLEPLLSREHRALFAEKVVSATRPTSWVFPCLPGVSEMISGKHGSIAVRYTAYPPLSVLCDAVGKALVSTSANLHGQMPTADPEEAYQAWQEDVAMMWDHPCGAASQPSQIIDGITGHVFRR